MHYWKVMVSSLERFEDLENYFSPEFCESTKIESSGMLSRVALVRADVSDEFSASFIRVTRIGELGTCCEEIRRS
jgi:hypothetical protein